MEAEDLQGPVVPAFPGDEHAHHADVPDALRLEPPNCRFHGAGIRHPERHFHREVRLERLYRLHQMRVPFIAAPMRHDHHAKTEIFTGARALQYSDRLARGKRQRNHAD